MTVLVTGGTGYIGGHVVDVLRRASIAVVVVDDIATGFAERLPADVPLLQLDLATTGASNAVIGFAARHGVDAVIHLAARKQVAESVAEPVRYFRDNLGGLGAVLDAATALGIRRVVFSSSAAVYGDVASSTVDETSPTVPINPYGATKLAGEWLVRDWSASTGSAAVSLRYFNVAGAASPLLADRRPLNLVPMVFEEVAAGRPARVFGADYDTADGTCVRDYVHVSDLAEAHLTALESLADAGGVHRVFNVGTGTGSSVLDVVAAVSRATGADVPVVTESRRLGDPPSVVGAVDAIREALGWRATRDLDDIVRSAWDARIARS